MLRNAGFTLIELLVVFTVIGIVLAFGVPSYSAFVQNSQIRNSAESIVDGLNIARMEAVNRNEPVTFTITGNDWSIDVPSSGEQVQARSGTEGSKNAIVSNLAQAPGAMSFQFNSMGRITSGNTSTVITVSSGAGECMPTGVMRCLRVQLSAGGRVRMCDPNLPSADPQACS